MCPCSIAGDIRKEDSLCVPLNNESSSFCLGPLLAQFQKLVVSLFVERCNHTPVTWITCHIGVGVEGVVDGFHSQPRPPHGVAGLIIGFGVASFANALERIEDPTQTRTFGT